MQPDSVIGRFRSCRSPRLNTRPRQNDQPTPGSIVPNSIAISDCACLAGAIPRAEYLRVIEEAGLVSLRIISETDAAELVAGALGIPVSELRGVVTSISFTARKPQDCC